MRNRSIRSHLTIRHSRFPLPPIEIAYDGDRYLIDLEHIHRMLQIGLSPTYCDVLALTADAHRISIPELMAAAVECEVQP